MSFVSQFFFKKSNYVSTITILIVIKKKRKIVPKKRWPILDPPYFIFSSVKLISCNSAIDLKKLVPITSSSEVGKYCSSQIPRVLFWSNYFRPYSRMVTLYENPICDQYGTAGAGRPQGLCWKTRPNRMLSSWLIVYIRGGRKNTFKIFVNKF